MACNTENHADAAVLAIKAIEDLDLTPIERIMVLTTATQIVENEVEAAATAMALHNALKPGTE